MVVAIDGALLMVGWQFKEVAQETKRDVNPISINLVDEHTARSREPNVESSFPQISGEGRENHFSPTPNPLGMPCKVQVHPGRPPRFRMRWVGCEAILADTLQMFGTSSMIDHDVLGERMQHNVGSELIAYPHASGPSLCRLEGCKCLVEIEPVAGFFSKRGGASHYNVDCLLGIGELKFPAFKNALRARPSS